MNADRRAAQRPGGAGRGLHAAPVEATSLVEPERTYKLSPLAALRPAGRACNLAKSAARALEVVEHLALSPKPLRGVDIARALALSPSSAHQILKTLMDGGWLLYDAGARRYHLAPRVARFAARTDGYFRPGALEQAMHAVQQTCGGAVTLAASQGGSMQVIEVVGPAAQPLRPSAAPPDPGEGLGARVPYFGTCTGAAWLSSQSDALVLSLMRRSRRELGKQARDEARVLESIRRVQRQGYAFGGLLAEDGVWSVAVPLPPAANGLVLVLAVSAPDRAIEGRAAAIARQMRSHVDAWLRGQ